ncbi:MAG: DUF4293 domain-containing protein [Bacteroidetes bacterium]|nr:DUF4293 domain-containing protein [Bacteroidota bacterium]
MIQRIQTVFILLAIISLGLFLYLPLITLEVDGNKFVEHIPGWDVSIFKEGYFYYVNAVFAGTAIGLGLISIFLYKRTGLQQLFCWFTIFFIIAAEAFVFYRYQTRMFPGDVVLRKWNILAAFALVFEILAVVYIRKDEDKLKSLDRLR